ncbi:Phage minor tail protein, partial [hydrothermal vent metagenome]
MAEMILPGTYIEVRPEGLIVPSRVSVGTVGVVGTASKGPVSNPE